MDSGWFWPGWYLMPVIAGVVGFVRGRPTRAGFAAVSVLPHAVATVLLGTILYDDSQEGLGR